MKSPFHKECDVWLAAAGITASSADGSAYSAHMRTDKASIAAYDAAEQGATQAASAVTVEAVFNPRLDGLRHITWCAAFVVYMQRFHANLLPANLQPKPGAKSWDEVMAEAAAARESKD